MLAICADPGAVRAGYHAVLSAVKSGELADNRLNESLNRIETAKSKLSAPLAFDPQRIAQLSDDGSTLNDRLGR
jgi:hypothetical protein